MTPSVGTVAGVLPPGVFAAGAAVDLEVGPLTVVALLLLFAASFFFSGTETALFSLQKVDRKWLARSDRTGKRAVWLLGKRQPLIATILMGNESANVAIATTTAALVAALAPDKPWINVVVLTPLIVLVSEITPKVLAFRYNRTWTRLAVWPLTLFYGFVAPVRVVFSGVVTLLARLFGADAEKTIEGLAEEELRILIDHGTAAGELDPMERDIIEAVFEFDELTVERLMTPRPDMFAVPLTIEWNELMRRAREEGWSRIPVYASRSDDIVGVLLLKDLLKHRRAPPMGPRQLRSLLLPPVFVPASKSADTMMREFLEKKFHMAFVVDEHGTLVGLITLDDLLEELVGELEGDTEESEIARITPESLTVKASIDIEDFEEETGIDLPDGDYHTLGGFVFHQLGRLPRQGDTVYWQGHAFTVIDMEGRRIAEVAVQVDPTSRAEQEAV